MRNVKAKCALLGISIIINAGGYISKGYIKLGDSTKELSKESEFLIQSKSLDDVYDTLEDRGITKLSKEAIKAIESICDSEIDEVYEQKNNYYKIDKYNDDYINILDINKLNAIDAYANFEKIEEIDHQNTVYYDEEKNSIDWENLAYKIYLNGINPSQNDNLKSTVNLSIKEIKEKLKTMKKFLEKVKQDFPDYDVKELACNLADYSFLKGIAKNKANRIIATTSSDKVTYYIKKEKDMSKKISRQTDYHEYFHVFTNNCEDIKNETSVVKDGIHILTPYYPRYYDNIKEDDLSVKRYRYSFLEEIYAELYASEANKNNQLSYENYDEILDLIQVTLGLCENYQIDSILKDLLYRDPITFIKHFPVYGDDEEKYFLDNLRMLKSFDVILEMPDWYLYKVKEKKLDINAMIQNLEALSLNQISKTFFNNLILINETHKEEMTLKDNFYLIHIFRDMLVRAAHSIREINKSDDVNNSYRSTLIYLFADTPIKEYFFKYLSDKYNLSEREIILEYQTIDTYYLETEEHYELPEFFGDKVSFYKEIVNRSFSFSPDIALRKVK